MNYRIRQALNDEDAEDIRDLQKILFPREENPDPATKGCWWIVDHLAGDDMPMPIAFGGVQDYKGQAYLVHAGVIPGHRGHGLQRRLIRLRLRWAKREGFMWSVTDTDINPKSANNLISCGFRMYQPDCPWKVTGAIYWRKALACRTTRA